MPGFRVLWALENIVQAPVSSQLRRRRVKMGRLFVTRGRLEEAVARLVNGSEYWRWIAAAGRLDSPLETGRGAGSSETRLGLPGQLLSMDGLPSLGSWASQDWSPGFSGLLVSWSGQRSSVGIKKSPVKVPKLWNNRQISTLPPQTPSGDLGN